MIAKLKGKTIGVIHGGFSRERDISLRSGRNVLGALQRLGYQTIAIDPAHDDLKQNNYDIAFNILHGQYGEDGTIQGFFEMIGTPYTGSGVHASVMGMNKWLTKQFLNKHHIPTPQYAFLTPSTFNRPNHLAYPLIVKPINEGSSVGVELVESDAEFDEKAQRVIQNFGCCLVEEFIEGAEITIGVLHKNDHVFALPILQLKPKNKFYDYEAKYTPGMTDFILPAELDEKSTKECQDVAVKMHRLMGCKGMSRIDAIFHPTKGVFVLEINTIPGMTDLSDLPAQAKCAGISFEELVETILSSAL